MNANISKPTTIIQIHLSCTQISKDDVVSKESIVKNLITSFEKPACNSLNINKMQQMGCPSLNFYNIESDNFLLPQAKKAGICTLNDTQNIDNQVPTHDTNTDNNKKQDTQCDQVKAISVTKEFLVETLKHDIRIKNFVAFSDNVFNVFFYTIEDSIPFYKQFYHYLQMEFQPEHDFILFSGIDILGVCEKELYSSEFIKKEKTNQNENISNQEVENETEPKTLEEFEARVNYFNKMKSMYSKNEIKKVMSFIENESFEYIFLNIKELCVGSSSNVVIQEMVKQLSNENLCRMIKAIGYEMAAICATKYGAYTIQTMIMACYTKEAQSLIVKYFGQQGNFLLCHEIGNYSIQRILLFNENYVFGLFKNNLRQVLKDNLGLKVFKRCVELLKGKTNELKAELKKNSAELGEELVKEVQELIEM